ncbi:IclR family transcriptional regulator [Haloferax sp. ATB1]|uniref:IclR family transcriptional regulator n=1 Tax=Haloferax sp. ATB1 TaxID=1508454 RepID=UPI0005B2335C|nr:IclR family transcriptional regulator [Haloferax sp. ATB1]
MDKDTTPKKGQSGGTPTIGSVETSYTVIDALQKLNTATVTEVASEAGLSKGGTFKHLKTLQQSGYVVREENLYRLGLRFLDIGGQLRYNHPGSRIIKDKMQELAVETNETSIYTVLENDRTTTLFRESGNRGVPTRTRIGKRLYPHETAAGKCILSQHTREKVERIFGGGPLPKVTDNTITDMHQFMEELSQVRERGYAYNLGESVEGLVAIAAPLAPDGKVLGACSVTGPYHRMKGDPIDEDIRTTLLSFVNELELSIAHSDTF